MHIEELLNDGLKREYKVVVPADDLESRMETILDDFRANVAMKGFRKGKAPMSLLKKMHGDKAMNQVISETMQETTQKVLEEKDVRPATQPDVEMDEFEQGSDLSFTMKMEILPAIETEGFTAPKLERWTAEVSDKDVDEALERIAADQKSFRAAAKTAKAKDGDAVLIDFVGRVDGEEFEGGKAEGHQLELGSGSFIPGFEEQLVGVKAGDEKVVTVTFPEQYQAEQLAGKEAEFTVTVQEVQKPAEAAVDDDMAKNLGFDDLDALKEQVRSQIESETGNLTRAHLKRQLLDQLAESYDFEVPQNMVDMEFRQIWEQIKRDAIQSGEATEEEFEGLDEPKDPKEAEEFKQIAERRVRLGLLLSELGVKNDIDVTQDEVNQRMVQEARRFPGQEMQVFQFFQQNEQARAQLRAPIFEEKVVDFILEMAEMDEKSVSRDELVKAVQEIDEEEADPKKAAKRQTGKSGGGKKAASSKSTSKKSAAKDDAGEGTEKKTAGKSTAKKSTAKSTAKSGTSKSTGAKAGAAKKSASGESKASGASKSAAKKPAAKSAAKSTAKSGTAKKATDKGD
ncbi:trigger factor [Yunchengibacter salinarum]|uniref:trigger factor n=1 Tax=Yunchengibacter salinarum TaxID=3133399 RepID=UPI0035B6A95B